jgi:leader peptidase (prepilin peptidase) / N-methyltransferase
MSEPELCDHNGLRKGDAELGIRPLPVLAFAVLYSAVAAPAAVWFQPPLSEVLSTLVLGTVLIVLSCVDLETYRLPDFGTLPLVALGIALTFVLEWDSWFWRVVAALCGYGVLYGVAALYRSARGRHGLGLGDAKLFAAAGAWLGVDGLPSVLLIGSLAALLFAGLTAICGATITAQTRIAFGPFLAFGFWVVWLYGPMTFGL